MAVRPTTGGKNASWLKGLLRHISRVTKKKKVAISGNFEGFTDICLENGSSQGQNLALTVVCVPSSLDSAPAYASQVLGSSSP